MRTTLLTGTGTQTYDITDTSPRIYFLYNYSGSLTIDIKIKQASIHIFGLYIGDQQESFQLNTTQRHSFGDSYSNLLIKGVFRDSSKLMYEGLIRIEQGAHGSNAYQKNQNLILSEGVFVDSRPFLEICADDVRCTHGSTTGRLRADQLEYVKSRGLTPEDALELLVDGFIDDLFSQMYALGESSITRESLGI